MKKETVKMRDTSNEDIDIYRDNSWDLWNLWL